MIWIVQLYVCSQRAADAHVLVTCIFYRKVVTLFSPWCLVSFEGENVSGSGVFHWVNRDLKQTRTATAVNKQLNFTVKNKPCTQPTIYTAYFKHILWLKVCERTVLTVLKSILSNTFHHGEGCRRAEDVEIRIFPSSARRQPSRRW